MPSVSWQLGYSLLGGLEKRGMVRRISLPGKKLERQDLCRMQAH
jgi:hypothetical protein